MMVKVKMKIKKITLFQYCSEDEGGATAEVDSDDE
jgi:hypothetical protein